MDTTRTTAPHPPTGPAQPWPPYQQGPYQQGPYQQGPYQQGPYQQGPYQQGPYQQGPSQPPPPPSWSSGAAATPPREPSTVSPAAEALGYAGGILTTVAVLYQLADVWSTLHAGVQAGLLGTASMALAVAAVVVGTGDRIASRLSSTLWIMAGLTGTVTAYLVVDSLAGLGVDAGLLAAGATAGAGGLALWLRTERPLFGAVAYGGWMVAIVGGVGFLGGDEGMRALALWGAGAVWLLLAGVGWIRRTAGAVSLGALTAIGAAQAVATDAPDAGILLGLVATAGLVALALLERQPLVWGWAGLAGLVFISQAAAEWVPEDLGWTVVGLVAGIGMLGGCTWLVARDRPGRSTGGGRAEESTARR